MIITPKHFQFLGIFCFCFSIFGSVNAQDLPFVKSCIQTLTSKEMYGRSASHKGELKAAKFVEATMKEYNIKPFKPCSYTQELCYANKSYVGDITLTINGEKLIPWTDFRLPAQSNCYNVNAKTLEIPSQNFKNQKVIPFKSNYNQRFLIANLTTVTDSANTIESVRRQIIQWANDNHALGLIFVVDNFRPLIISEAKLYTNLIILDIDQKSLPKKHNEVQLTGKAVFNPEYTTQNIIGYTEGFGAKDSFIVMTAHYDHLGTMGDQTIFYGANDNASGTAVMLSLAKAIQEKPAYYSVIYIACGGEEMGLKGSEFFVENPWIDLSKIKIELNFDIFGTGENGICFKNGVNHPQIMEKLIQINEDKKYVKAVNPIPNNRASDHYYFTVKGIPAFYVQTQGNNQNIHQPNDLQEYCTLVGYEGLFKLLMDYIDQLR